MAGQWRLKGVGILTFTIFYNNQFFYDSRNDVSRTVFEIVTAPIMSDIQYTRWKWILFWICGCSEFRKEKSGLKLRIIGPLCSVYSTHLHTVKKENMLFLQEQLVFKEKSSCCQKNVLNSASKFWFYGTFLLIVLGDATYMYLHRCPSLVISEHTILIILHCSKRFGGFRCMWLIPLLQSAIS